MMSARGGGRGIPKVDESTGKLRMSVTVTGKGVKKSGNYADVICTFPLTVRHQLPPAARAPMFCAIQFSAISKSYAISNFGVAASHIMKVKEWSSLAF